jgi:malic enzyme
VSDAERSVDAASGIRAACITHDMRCEAAAAVAAAAAAAEQEETVWPPRLHWQQQQLLLLQHLELKLNNQ